jgi:hypothetical protein
MPDSLSMFTPCGMLELSSEPSHAEVIYNDLVTSLSSRRAFDMSPGTRMEAWAYALSMAIAAAQYALDRGGNQAHPLTAWDLLPLLEQAYLVVPDVAASVADRAAVLAAIDSLLAGGRFPDMAGGLRTLLGAEFLALVPVGTIATPTQWPATPATGGGNWVDPRTASLPIAIADPVATTGTQWVAYTLTDQNDLTTATWMASSTYASGAAIVPTTPNGYEYQCTKAGVTGTTEPVFPTAIGATVTDGAAVWTCTGTTVPQLQVGQTITVQAENTNAIENVTVLAVSLTAQGTASEGPCFEATFAKAHDAGASIETGALPYWGSTQRCLLVVTPLATASDRETRRQVDEYMRKPTRGVDTWAIVGATSTTVLGGTIGGVTVGGPMGTQTIGTYTFTGTP